MRTLAAAVVIAASLASAALAQDRVALVIGNDRYPNLPADQQLQKAVNDARAVSRTLEAIGFKVTRGENLDRAQMVDHVFRFAQAIRPGDTAVVFFAGHGVSLAGGNYLVPTDTPMMRPGEEAKARNMALSEADIVGDIQASRPRVMVMILDACRDNPFKQPGLTRSLGAQTGLARGREAEGVFTIYSAGFGQAALDRLDDNDKSPNSVFTRVLLPALARTDTHLADIVIDMREEIARLAGTIGHRQSPAYYDQTQGGRVYLAARGASPGMRPARKVALLIGNNSYPDHISLKTPGNDVDAVAAMLREGGFNPVIVKKDLAREPLRSALHGFAAEAAGAEVALVFYSGHGTRMGKERLLLATDLKFKTLEDVLPQGINVNEAIDATRGAATRLIVLDADQKEVSRSAVPATPQADALDPRGSVVVYSSGATEAAFDGDGPTSPFTTAFLKHLKPRGVPFLEAFGRVQQDVATASNNQQTPAIYGDLPAQFSLVAR